MTLHTLTLKPLFAQCVTDLQLSARAYRAVTQNGLYFVAELVMLTLAHARAMFKPEVVGELLICLRERGTSFGRLPWNVSLMANFDALVLPETIVRPIEQSFWRLARSAAYKNPSLLAVSLHHGFALTKQQENILNRQLAWHGLRYQMPLEEIQFLPAVLRETDCSFG